MTKRTVCWVMGCWLLAMPAVAQDEQTAALAPTGARSGSSTEAGGPATPPASGARRDAGVRSSLGLLNALVQHGGGRDIWRYLAPSADGTRYVLTQRGFFYASRGAARYVHPHGVEETEPASLDQIFRQIAYALKAQRAFEVPQRDAGVAARVRAAVEHQARTAGGAGQAAGTTEVGTPPGGTVELDFDAASLTQLPQVDGATSRGETWLDANCNGPTGDWRDCEDSVFDNTAVIVANGPPPVTGPVPANYHSHKVGKDLGSEALFTRRCELCQLQGGTRGVLVPDQEFFDEWLTCKTNVSLRYCYIDFGGEGPLAYLWDSWCGQFETNACDL